MKINEVWSGAVKTHAHPPEGLFANGTAAEMAKWALKSHDNDKKRAVAALNFYVNRAGKNLSDKHKATVKHAVKLVSENLEPLDEGLINLEKLPPGGFVMEVPLMKNDLPLVQRFIKKQNKGVMIALDQGDSNGNSKMYHIWALEREPLVDLQKTVHDSDGEAMFDGVEIKRQKR